MFLSVVFTVEHGISESNKDQDLKFGCRSVSRGALMISDIIGPNGQQ